TRHRDRGGRRGAAGARPRARGLDHRLLRAERGPRELAPAAARLAARELAPAPDRPLGCARARARPRTAGRIQAVERCPKRYLIYPGTAGPGWCNWQHATLWMLNLGFESLSRS